MIFFGKPASTFPDHAVITPQRDGRRILSDISTWTGGCYGTLFGPNVWTRYGRALREPVGPIRWAGTETASAWAGYMDGAVRSGEQAAAEVLRLLS